MFEISYFDAHTSLFAVKLNARGMTPIHYHI